MTKLGTLGLGGGHLLIKNRAENSYATTFPEPNLILPRVWLCRLLALTWAVSTSVPSSPSAWILVNFGVAWDPVNLVNLLDGPGEALLALGGLG